MRIMPRINEAVNEEWISDKTRFIWDGLRTKRLDRPYVRKNGKLEPVSWSEAFDAIAEKVTTTDVSQIGAIAGDLSSVEEMYALQQLMSALGSPNLDCRQAHSALDPALGRSSYLFNTTIESIEESDALLIIGCNPRKEAAVLNSRIRKRWRQGNYPVALVGEEVDLTYEYDHAAFGPEDMDNLQNLWPDTAEKPMFIIGEGAFARKDGVAVLAMLAKLALEHGVVKDGWNGFNILHSAAARVGALDIGFVPGEGGLATAEMLEQSELLFLLGADELNFARRTSGFTVYIGSHGDNGAEGADVILPGSAYTEKSGTYVNTEGRVQRGNRAGFAPGEAKEDWAIIRALSDVLDKKLPFDSLSALRQQMIEAHPHLGEIDEIAGGDIAGIEALATRKGRMARGVFLSSVDDFYLSNPICRASDVMAECSNLARKQRLEAAE